MSQNRKKGSAKALEIKSQETKAQETKASETKSKELKLKQGPGRPAGKAAGENVRTALMQAAKEGFACRGFKEFSLRQIAAVAGVNPAMVHYYFGSKEGLYFTILEESVAPLIEQIHVIQNGEKPSDGMALANFLQTYMTLMLNEPWLPNLIVREILYQEGELREKFINRIASKGGKLFSGLLQQAKTDGHLPKEIQPQLGALSIISMALFPFIARPVMEKVFNISMDENFVEQMVAHITGMMNQKS